MIISGRFWRRTIVTAIAAIGFVSLYEVTALDSKYAARFATLHEAGALPFPGARLAFSATAYCKGMVTASGVPVQSGVAAADPELLPALADAPAERGEEARLRVLGLDLSSIT